MSEKTNKNVEKPYTDPITGKFVEGNPGGGRPKGSYSVVEMIKKKLQETPEGKDKTYGEYFVEKIMKKIAVDEDVSMMKDIINRVDGLPKQNMDITSGDKPIPIMSLNAILPNDSNQQNKEPDEEN